jgi:hypothetical protein
MKNLKNLLMILLVSSMIVNNTAIANDATVLVKGELAPYTGVLLPEEKANSIYNDLNRYKLLNESLERTVSLYEQNEKLQDKKVNTLLEQNDKLAINLQQARTTSNWEKVLWFGLGFLSVGLGIYGVKAITK